MIPECITISLNLKMGISMYMYSNCYFEYQTNTISKTCLNLTCLMVNVFLTVDFYDNKKNEITGLSCGSS